MTVISKPRPRSRSIAVGFAAAALLIAAGLYALLQFTPTVKPPGFVEGQALLAPGDKPFVDTQVGLRFTPPPGWAMQVRTTEAPGAHSAERRIVKYKRLIRGPRAAWLRVIVADAPNNPTPEDVLKNRKPPETGWTITKEVESGLTIGGLPAARLTYGGEFDPDVAGARACTAEVVAVRCGARSFIFAGTFTADDEEARKEIRVAIESAVFEKRAETK